MNSDLSWYRAALAGEKPAIWDGHPKCGYFRRRFKLENGTGKYSAWVAACIWVHDGRMVCRVADKMADAQEEWLWLAKNPVKAADAKHWFEHRRWPNEPDMSTSEITVSDLAKAWKSLKEDADVRSAMIDAAGRIYATTGKLPLGFEIVAASEIAA